MGDAPPLKLVPEQPPLLKRLRVPVARGRSRSRRVIAVGGGKGGIGKSLIASNLAIELARRGKRVVLLDADLGGANLHTCLGVELPKKSISDFVERRIDKLEEIVTPT